MPRNLYKRGGVWWGRVKIAGRQHRRSLRTSDEREARQRLKAWKNSVTAAAYFGIQRYSWKEAVVKWQHGGCGGLKPRTAERYLCSLKMVRGVVDDLYLDQIGRRELGKIAARPGATNATRRRDLTAVSTVLRAAVAWGWIETNPARDYDRAHIRERRDPIALPTDEDIATFVAGCPTDMTRALVRFLLSTGMRLNEAVELERRQVDLQGGQITLDRTKTDRPRVVPMRPEAVTLIDRLPVRLGCPWVFWHGEGRRFDLHRLSSELARVKGRRGLRFRVHDLRHRFAVDYLRRGGSIYDLQHVLGHQSIKTTEIYLAYLSPEQQRGAMRTAG